MAAVVATEPEGAAAPGHANGAGGWDRLVQDGGRASDRSVSFRNRLVHRLEQLGSRVEVTLQPAQPVGAT